MFVSMLNKQAASCSQETHKLHCFTLRHRLEIARQERNILVTHCVIRNGEQLPPAGLSAPRKGTEGLK